MGKTVIIICALVVLSHAGKTIAVYIYISLLIFVFLAGLVKSKTTYIMFYIIIVTMISHKGESMIYWGRRT